jgi:hypothetical protein
MWSSIPWSGEEVAGAELVGDTDLGRGRSRRMERGHDERRESGRGHAARACGGGAQHTEQACDTGGGDAGKGGVRPVSGGTQRVERAGDAGGVRPDE